MAERTDLEEKARRRADELIAQDRRHPLSELGERPRERTPDLNQQTPGLDADRPMRDLQIRFAAWLRERPLLTLAVMGGAFFITWRLLKR